MDKDKIGLLLEKINGMYRSLAAADTPPEPIERDLMLSYIRQLYEAFQDSPSPQPDRPDVQPPPAPPREPEPPAPRTPVYTPPPPDPQPERPEPPATTGGHASMGKLFEQPRTNELGDKLSNSPIADLRKAFTINDRLLYTNELFGGDKNTFERALYLLDQYDHFQEAKHYLEQMADQYEWLNEEREEIARDFVRTVRRKFSR